MIWAELAHQVGIVPLVWMGFLRSVQMRRGAAWWWIASAFAVSWLADWAAHWMSPWGISAVYLVTQSTILVATLAERAEAQWWVGIVGLAALVSLVWTDARYPDLLLHATAFGALALLAYERPALGRLRASLLTYFGAGGIAWAVYAVWPSVPTWAGYQACRAVGIGLFCWAAWKPAPTLRIA